MSGVIFCSEGCGSGGGGGGGACISSSAVPKIQRQVGAGTITVPTLTAYSVTVSVGQGPITVQAGADPAVTLESGASFTWAVDSCSQRLGAALVFTSTMPGHDFILASTQ